MLVLPPMSFALHGVQKSGSLVVVGELVILICAASIVDGNSMSRLRFPILAAQEVILQSQSIELAPKITNCRISANYFYPLWSSLRFHPLQGLVNIRVLFLM